MSLSLQERNPITVNAEIRRLAAQIASLQSSITTLQASVADLAPDGVFLDSQISTLINSYTLTSTTASQAVFPATQNTLTVEASSTYMVDALIHISGMSATSGNYTFSFLGAGTATVSSARIHIIGVDSTTPTTAAAQDGALMTGAASTGAVLVAAAGTASVARFSGLLRTGTAGTLIPSVSLTTAAAALVNLGSYISMSRVGASSMTTVGGWA